MTQNSLNRNNYIGYSMKLPSGNNEYLFGRQQRVTPKLLNTLHASPEEEKSKGDINDEAIEADLEAYRGYEDYLISVKIPCFKTKNRIFNGEPSMHLKPVSSVLSDCCKGFEDCSLINPVNNEINFDLKSNHSFESNCAEYGNECSQSILSQSFHYDDIAVDKTKNNSQCAYLQSDLRALSDYDETLDDDSLDISINNNEEMNPESDSTQIMESDNDEVCEVESSRSITSESMYHDSTDNDAEINTQRYYMSDDYKSKIIEAELNNADENSDPTRRGRYISCLSQNNYLPSLKTNISEASSVKVIKYNVITSNINYFDYFLQIY